MATTTRQLIRESQSGFIAGLRASQLSRYPFKHYKLLQPFEDWCEANPGACMRSFWIRSNADEEVRAGDQISEEIENTIEVAVAYPLDNRFGLDGVQGLQDVIDQDYRKIDSVIGYKGYGNYVAGHNLCILESSTIEEGESVWFLRMTYRINFRQAVNLGVLQIVARITALATATADAKRVTYISGAVTAAASASARLAYSTSGAITATATMTCSVTTGPSQLLNLDFSSSAPSLTTELRNCAIVIPVTGYDDVASFSANVLPIGGGNRFASGLGAYFNNAHTNLAIDSVDLAGFLTSTSNATVTDDTGDAPDGGVSTASDVTVSANNGFARATINVSSSQDYLVSYFTRRNGGADVGGKIRVYDVQAASFASPETTWTATSVWQRESMSFTTGGTTTQCRPYVQLNTSGQSAFIWGFDLVAGVHGSGDAHIQTAGATASLVQSDFRAAGNYINEDIGEIQVTFVCCVMPLSGERHYIFDTGAAADRRALYVDDAGNLQFLVNDSAGSAVATVNLGAVTRNAEHDAICQWDKDASLGTSNSVSGSLDGGTAVSGGTSFTAGGGFTAEICIGASQGTAGTALDGYIQTLISYDGVN